MKAFFKNGIMGYRGTCDGLTYYYNRRLGRILVRAYVKPKSHWATRRMGTVSGNLKALGLSEGFIGDLRVYTDIYNRRTCHEDSILTNWYIAFTKMMWNLAKSDPAIDLSTITREQIEANDLPCRSVKRAVEAGLLVPVNGYELLTQVM